MPYKQVKAIFGRRSYPTHKLALGGKIMAMLNDGPGRIIDINPKSVSRVFGLAVAALVLVIFVFASIARVDSGHVGVLTLFGRVTGEILSEGIHMVNHFQLEFTPRSE
jgi:regulator of protease activity HflC (stomatin/prohibitin superfamily)